MNDDDKALLRLYSMVDWIELNRFNHKKLLKELEIFKKPLL